MVLLQRHHFAQTMCILNSEGCNIFKNLTGKVRHFFLSFQVAHEYSRLPHAPSPPHPLPPSFLCSIHKLVQWLCIAIIRLHLSFFFFFFFFQDYEEVFILIRDIILATDLAHHLKILQDIKKMAEGETNFSYSPV